MSTATRGVLRHLLTSANPAYARGRTVTVGELMEEAAKDLDRNPPALGAVESDTRAMLGETFYALGRNSTGYVHIQDPAPALRPHVAARANQA